MESEERYFSPESTIWRIGRESVLMLGGGRALLMQAAHPLVAAGIVEHSSYGERPWRRLARTMTALYTVVYGSKAEAERAGARVRSVHAKVSGRIRERMGVFPAGTPYSAQDPALQLWVHATLVDTGLVMYETYVRPLARDEQEGFYQDMKVVARMFGMPAGVIPATLADFWAYKRERLASDEIRVTDAARKVGEVVLDPPVPFVLRPAFRALKLATIGLLPEELRAQYGLRWNAAHQALLAASAESVRRLLLPRLPARLRVVGPEDLAERSKARPLGLLAALAS